MLHTLVNLAANATDHADMTTLAYWSDHVEYFAYLIAALLFIMALAGLSNQTTALRGNKFGIAGMSIALVSICLLYTSDAADE